MADDPSTSIDAEPAGGTLSQARATFEADRAVLTAENDTYTATREEDLATLDTAVNAKLASDGGLARLDDDNLQNDGEAILSGITFGNFGLTQEKDAAEKEIEHNQGVVDLADHEVAQHQADHDARVATLSDKLDGDLRAMDPNDKLSALTEARADLEAAPVFVWGRSSDGIKEAQLADFDQKYKAEMDAATATASAGASGHDGAGATGFDPAAATAGSGTTSGAHTDPSTSPTTDPTASLDDQQFATGATTTSGPTQPAADATNVAHFATTGTLDGSTAPDTVDHDDSSAGEHFVTSPSGQPTEFGPDHTSDGSLMSPTDTHTGETAPSGSDTQTDVSSSSGFDTPSAEAHQVSPLDHDIAGHDPTANGMIEDHHSG